MTNLMDTNGEVRPHWEPFLAAIADLPPSERTQRAERLNSRVREMGIAHDIFADPTSPGKRWEVDLVPLILSSSEWHALEAALIQRARLLNTILADVYGEQKLLRQGLIPPALLFSDLAFLNPCHGITPSGQVICISMRSIWRARSTAAGASSTITPRRRPASATRSPTASCTPTSPATCSKPATAPAPGALLPAGADRPDAADRAPRSAHRAADTGAAPRRLFQPAYLARYLGYLLVEGGDLRTAGDRLFLKTLEGLKRIDLIVRCVDGRQSDPLELDSAR